MIAGVQKAKQCGVHPAGRPVSTEATASDKVIYATEHGQHVGYVAVNVFATPESVSRSMPEKAVPISIVLRLPTINVITGREPLAVATALSGQGTAKATGVFRSTLSERREFCDNFVGGRSSEAILKCLRDHPDTSFRVQANCETRFVTVFEQSYRLFQRKIDFPAVTHSDEQRGWLWRNVATDAWLDGSGASNEIAVDSAFDAICPGRRPDAKRGLVFRDAAAQFPSELVGFWAEQLSSCRQGQTPGERAEDAVTITRIEVRGYEHSERLNQIRRSEGGWIVDSSWEGEGETALVSISYRLVRDGLSVTDANGTRRLIRCSR